MACALGAGGKGKGWGWGGGGGDRDGEEGAAAGAVDGGSESGGPWTAASPTRPPKISVSGTKGVPSVEAVRCVRVCVRASECVCEGGGKGRGAREARNVGDCCVYYRKCSGWYMLGRRRGGVLMSCMS